MALHSRVGSWSYPKHLTSLERRVKDKHSSLFGTVVSYEESKVS
jgi:hypothetical protein